jgi:LuxR family maltose regulon positive regulatory protein
MPYNNMPWIRGNEMLYLPARTPIRVGSPAWFTWLAEARAFCYQPPSVADRMTVRREKRRHQFYWYAYLKSASKLHNAYVGKTESLTVDRLHEVFDHLLGKVRAQRQRCWDE